MDSFDDSLENAASRALRLGAENAELKIQRQELQDTLDSIHSGDVDALVVNGAIYTLESAQLASNQLRQDVLGHVDRNGEAEALGGLNHGGIDADDVGPAIDERSAAVAGIQRSSVLNDVLD